MGHFTSPQPLRLNRLNGRLKQDRARMIGPLGCGMILMKMSRLSQAETEKNPSRFSRERLLQTCFAKQSFSRRLVFFLLRSFFLGWHEASSVNDFPLRAQPLESPAATFFTTRYC